MPEPVSQLRSRRSRWAQGHTPRATLLLALVVGGLAATSADAAPLLTEHFDFNTSALSGKQGFNSKYCADPWTTALNGGVIAKTDNGCSCGLTGGSSCDYAVYTAKGNGCYKSEPVDNVLVVGSATWADYELNVRLRNLDDDTLGVVFRYQNTANYYAVWLSRDVGPGVNAACDGSFPGARLVKVSSAKGAGKATLIAASPTTYAIGKVHLLRVRVKGSSIEVFFDANADGKIDPGTEQLFNAWDTSLSHGAVGLYAYQNGAAKGTKCAKGGCWFDDLTVSSLAIAGPGVAPDAGGPDAGGPDAGGADAGSADAVAGTADVGATDVGAAAADAHGAGDAAAQADASATDEGRASGAPQADAAGAAADATAAAGDDTGAAGSDSRAVAEEADATAAAGDDTGAAGSDSRAVAEDVDSNAPLVLVDLSGPNDGGCAAGRRGSPLMVWVALLAMIGLGWRRRRAR